MTTDWKPTEEMLHIVKEFYAPAPDEIFDVIKAISLIQPLIAAEALESFLKRVKTSGLDTFNSNADLVKSLRAMIEKEPQG